MGFTRPDLIVGTDTAAAWKRLKERWAFARLVGLVDRLARREVEKLSQEPTDTTPAELGQQETEESGPSKESAVAEIQVLIDCMQNLLLDFPQGDIRTVKEEELPGPDYVPNLEPLKKAVARLEERGSSICGPNPVDVDKLAQEDLNDLQRTRKRLARRTAQSLETKSEQKAPDSPLQLSNMTADENGFRILLSQRFSKFQTFNDVMYFLIKTKPWPDYRPRCSPDLWVRCDEQSFDLRWRLAMGYEKIDESILEIDVVNGATNSDYMVAAVKAGDQKKPIPINLHRFGVEACCPHGCTPLRDHLDQLWGPREVAHAEWFDPSGKDKKALDAPLNSSYFRVKENEVYLKYL